MNNEFEQHIKLVNREIIDIIVKLKEEPLSEKVDHVLLFNKLYSHYTNGATELKPIVDYYLNGFDDLPALNEKHLWNESKFKELRKEFVSNHNELVNIINLFLKEQKINGDKLFNPKLTKSEFLKQVKLGVKFFEGVDLENIDFRNESLTGLTFKNCFISSDFRNTDLTNTKFLNGNIKTSDFRGANLTNGLMEYVSFEGTKFKGAKVKGFIFKDNYCYSEEEIGQVEFNDWVIKTE